MASTSFVPDGWVVVDFDGEQAPTWAHWFESLDEAERFVELVDAPSEAGPIPTLRSRLPAQRTS